MIRSTWLHISDRLQKEEKEFDRQVIRAASIGHIGGRSGAGPELSVMSLIVFCRKIELFSENFRPGPEILPDLEKRRTEKSEARADG